MYVERVRLQRPTAVVVSIVVMAVAGSLLVACGQNGAAPSRSTGPRAKDPSSSIPAADPGYVHTAGTRIVDASGQTVQLTGFNVQGMETTNADGSDIPGECNNAWRPLTSDEVGQIAGYGFRTVRLPVAWGNLEPAPPTVAADGSLIHHWNAAYVDRLRTEVGQLGTAGMSVILDMHQSSWSAAFLTPSTAKRPSCPGSGMPVWLNPDASTETPQQAACGFYAGRTEPGVPGTAWSDFAAAESYLDGLFVDAPTVIGQDVVNEPSCGHGTANLDGFYATVASAVAKANRHLLIILEDRDDPGTFMLTRLPSLPNVVLSVHLHEDYWTAPSSGQQPLPFDAEAALTADLQRAQHWNVPLYVGEFYAFDGTGSQGAMRQPDPNWIGDTESFVSYCRQHNVSWTFWSWTQKLNPELQPELTSQALAALSSG